MARQLPEASESQKSPSQNGVGMYGSYYKVYRCSDGKYRLNLITEDEYVESKKNRPISVCDVSSTTDVTCSQRPSSLLTSSPCCRGSQPPRSTAAVATVHGPLRRTHSATPRSRLPSISQRISSAKTTTHDVVPHHQRAAAVPVRHARKHPYKRNTTASSASVATAGTDHDHPGAVIRRPARRDRCVRSTVAVADLIAEYIPPDVPSSGVVVQDAVASSTSAVKPAAQPVSNSTPLVWNNWIKSVARRFPMADMSVRQVLDVLDSRPDLTVTDD